MAEWADLAACDPQDALHRQEQLKALRDCLEILEEKKRTLLVLHDLEGVKFDEIAARFSMTSTAVGVTLYRTRMALRDCVEERLAS
jgi:RNA polymerase sigma-70 factor (ECF subfamily)